VNSDVKEFADIVHLLIALECASCQRVFAEPTGDTEEEIWDWSKKVSIQAYEEGWRSTDKGFLCLTCLRAAHNE
jgi:hypothetical protein